MFHGHESFADTIHRRSSFAKRFLGLESFVNRLHGLESFAKSLYGLERFSDCPSILERSAEGPSTSSVLASLVTGSLPIRNAESFTGNPRITSIVHIKQINHLISRDDVAGAVGVVPLVSLVGVAEGQLALCTVMLFRNLERIWS